MCIVWQNYNTIKRHVFYIVINVWVTIVFEKWKARESELKYLWNTSKTPNESKRVDYIGNYSIDESRKTIKEAKVEPELMLKMVI